MTTAPFVPGSKTSREAAGRIAPHVGSIKETILAFIIAKPGCIRDEIIGGTGLHAGSVAPRLKEMERDGEIRKDSLRAGADREAWEWVAGAPDYEVDDCTTPLPSAFSGTYGEPVGLWQGRVAQCFEACPDLTDDECFLMIGVPEWQRLSVSRARARLVQKGWLVDSGTTRETTSGRAATVWRRRAPGEVPASQRSRKRTAPPTRREAPSREYDTSAKYVTGDTVLHPTYGTGKVTAVDLDGTGITVDFNGSERELVCGVRSAA